MLWSEKFFKNYRSINEKREDYRLEDVIMDAVKPNDVFRNLTRVEKWFIIMAWFYFDAFAVLESNNNEKFEIFLKSLENKRGLFIADFEMLKISAQYRIIEQLRV